MKYTEDCLGTSFRRFRVRSRVCTALKITNVLLIRSRALAHHALSALLALVQTSPPSQSQRLRLALISSLSGLDLPLLSIFADRARDTILPIGEEEWESRNELWEALFEELVVNSGDREKEWAMRWWADNKPTAAPTMLPSEDEKGKGRVQLYA